MFIKKLDVGRRLHDDVILLARCGSMQYAMIHLHPFMKSDMVSGGNVGGCVH
jgi:hypothetical protein